MKLFVDIATKWELHNLLLKPLDQPPLNDIVGFCTRTERGEVAGIIGFYGHRHGNIEGHMRGIRRIWASEKLFEISLDFVYNALQVNRITAGVYSWNEPSLKVLRRLGFRKEGVLREYKNGDDLIIMGMLRRECRYINNGTLTKNEKVHSNKQGE